MMTVKITLNERGNPPGKIADAELHFEMPTSPAQYAADVTSPSNALIGLKLIGFAVWETRTGQRRNVTFPARAYSVNGERRSFALLRPIADTDAQQRIRDLILEACAAEEERYAADQKTASAGR